MKRRWIVTASSLAVVVSVGVASFWGVRTYGSDGSPAVAQPGDGAGWQRTFNEDAQKPQYDQTINGIRVGPKVDYRGPEACQGIKAEYVPLEKASGTQLDIKPVYLPDGVELVRTEAVECGGTLVSVLKEYVVSYRLNPTNAEIPLWSGGGFTIYRVLGADNVFPLFGAAERFGPTTIKGKAGVLMRPVMPEGIDNGMGFGAIVVKEPFGLTVLQGDGMPLGEFVKVAESLN